MADIAQELCIIQRYVRAIESGDVKNLPGLFFYKSFVRQYAAILRTDEKLILPQLQALSAAEEPSPHPDIRVLDPLVEQANRRFVPDIPLGWSVAGLALAVLLCSGFYTWWTRIPEPKAVSKTAQVTTTQLPTIAAVDAQPAVDTQATVDTQPAVDTQAAIDTQPVIDTLPVVRSEPEALSGIGSSYRLPREPGCRYRVAAAKFSPECCSLANRKPLRGSTWGQ